MQSIHRTSCLDHAWELYTSGQVISAVGITAAQAVFALDPAGDSPLAAVEALAGLLDARDAEDDEAPAEPALPAGPSREDETWWLTYCTSRDAVLDRMLALQPVELSEEDWACYAAVRLEEDRVNGYWAGLDERGDRP